MSRQLPYSGEIIGLAVMLLMVVALVAAQADASMRSSRVPGEPHQTVLVADPADTEPRARVRAVIDLDALTIAIDASATIAPPRLLNRGN